MLGLKRSLIATVLLVLGHWASAETLLCADISDIDQTRLVIEFDPEVRTLVLVTPEFLWSDPQQPETQRFPAGKTDTSPNLAARANVSVRLTRDPAGTPRTLHFSSLTPDALQLAGLRGELLIHDDWQADNAVGSLFYAATGNIQVVVPVQCQHSTD
jgi:hypothetical protein